MMVMVALVMMALAVMVAAAPKNHLSSTLSTECGCGSSSLRKGRIVGGEELEKNGAPWLVSLARGHKSHCGAALISGSHILTAAHCIDGLSVSELRAWMGVHSLASAGLAMAARSFFRGDDVSEGEYFGRSISKAWSHPDFDASTFRNDIAVLELRYPVKISATLYPICLPYNERELYARRMAIVAGWGRIGEKEEASDVPRKTMVEVWTPEQCMKSGYPKARLRGSIICAGQKRGGQDACQGDSGGPLVVPGVNGDMEIIGIVSWGRGCARPKYPGIYTRVTGYLNFIKDAVSNICPNFS